MPSENPLVIDKYYCAGHVPRGCSCMINEDGTEPLEDDGRRFPCCEYGYDEKGFDYEDQEDSKEEAYEESQDSD